MWDEDSDKKPHISDTLMEANVTVDTNKLCQLAFNEIGLRDWLEIPKITDGMLCAGDPDMDACQVKFQ